MSNQDIRNRFPGKEKSDQNVEDIPLSSSEKKRKGNVDNTGLVAFLTQPQDPANLGVFRFFFGILMMIDIPQERGMSSIADRWEDSTLCFFPLFNWLKPLPIDWMYVVYLLMFMAAFGIAVGCCYRSSCLLFILTYWYIFFLDKTVWNNHSYLYGLISIMLLMTNANRYWSIDGYFNESIRNTCVPRWNYWLIKFQIFLVYFYAGVKKLDMDWMSGYSMTGLSRKWVFDPFRIFVSNEFIDLYMVHISGLIFDLSEGFLLLFDKTRSVGVFFGSMFHLMNSQMFSIGMFPWTMLATMPFFFRSDWPRRLSRAMPACFGCFLPLRDDPKVDTRFTERSENDSTFSEQRADECQERYIYIRKTFLIGLASVYVLVQLFLPWSHFITQGYNAWTNGLYGYSWDMMVHSWSTQHLRVEVVDMATNKSNFLIPGVWIAGFSRRKSRWSSHPDMTKQYAMCLAGKLRDHAQLNITDPAIYFDIWRSMNRRFQQRIFDPRVDIVKASWSPFEKPKWVLPLMIDLSPWRSKLDEIEREASKNNNYSDVVFVADFPGLNLENFVKEDLNASITVLEGTLVVEQGGRNVTLEKNEVHVVQSNDTHIVHTVSQVPSCWMYLYTNTTLANNVTLQEHEHELRTQNKNSNFWKNLTVVEKFEYFMARKMYTFAGSFYDAFNAVRNIVYGRQETGDAGQEEWSPQDYGATDTSDE